MGDMTYKVHLDGFNLLPYLKGEVKESPRNFFFYISDDGDVLGIRYDNWKLVFMEQRCHGTMQVWAEPFTKLRLPKLFEKFEQAVRKWPECIECMTVTGAVDYVMRIVTTDMHAYDNFLRDKILALGLVSDIQSRIIVNVSKRTTAAPLASA